jgi:hypothetical protein
MQNEQGFGKDYTRHDSFITTGRDGFQYKKLMIRSLSPGSLCRGLLSASN